VAGAPARDELGQQLGRVLEVGRQQDRTASPRVLIRPLNVEQNGP
jgi:hypothetical protein